MRLPTLAACLALLVGAGTAHAEDYTRTLAAYETEARALGTDLPRPNQLSAFGQKRLVDAQVAFATGDYDTAVLALFDIVGKASGQDKETATFYLGESLYSKGARGSARTYFQAVADMGPSSKYYQSALQRIVEIAIRQKDTQGAETASQSLDSSPRSQYIRGKLAFAEGKYDDALGYFNGVAKGSDQELTALYYAGTTHVAKQDLAKAAEVFADLVRRPPRTNTDRRVVELSQLALARVYYEQEQPSKAIDTYLLVDRNSDLFPAALYEVSWVYVKSKQYDKALVALELLEKLDPNSSKTPTVRILEGNLRIRKAQLLRQAEITGTLNSGETSTPSDEYAKAEAIFTETHDQYKPSYVALSKMVDGTADGSVNPAAFIDQVAERNTRVSREAAPLPDAAAQWLREQPEVQRVIAVENDLVEIQANIDSSEAMIGRLEGVLASGDRLTLYPALSSRRMRIAAMEHDLIGLRNQMADEQIRAGASAGAATATRQALAAQYKALGNPEEAHNDRTAATSAGYDKIGGTAAEVGSALTSTQAMSVALRKYMIDVDVPEDQKAPLQQGLDEAAKEARAIEDELVEINKEIVLGKDLAAVGDADLMRARDLRAQLRAAQDAEQRALAAAGRAHPQGDRAMQLAALLDQTDGTIDQLVVQNSDQLKQILAEERKNLDEYKGQLVSYEAEARGTGGAVLASTFEEARDAFYDIVVRTDVGGVDVAWSQKEDSDDDYKRLNLARSRDLKQLRDEFRFVLDETVPTPALPRPAPAPSPEGQTSPDKGTSPDQRINPAGEQQPKDNTPTVKPDSKAGGSK